MAWTAFFWGTCKAHLFKLITDAWVYFFIKHTDKEMMLWRPGSSWTAFNLLFFQIQVFKASFIHPTEKRLSWSRGQWIKGIASFWSRKKMIQDKASVIMKDKQTSFSKDPIQLLSHKSQINSGRHCNASHWFLATCQTGFIPSWVTPTAKCIHPSPFVCCTWRCLNLAWPYHGSLALWSGRDKMQK